MAGQAAQRAARGSELAVARRARRGRPARETGVGGAAQDRGGAGVTGAGGGSASGTAAAGVGRGFRVDQGSRGSAGLRLGRARARRRRSLAASGRAATGGWGSVGPSAPGPATRSRRGDRARRRNIASSSWKRSPPMPARFGSMAASRRATAASARRSRRAAPVASRPRARCGSPRRPGRAAPVGPARAPRGCPATRPPPRRHLRPGVEEASTASASASPSSSRTSASVILGRGREQLVEHRLRVAHATGRESGDQVDGRRFDPPAVGREDPAEFALDLGDGQPSDVVALEARQDRRREPRRLGRGEHEDDEVGRLLERLEQRVPGVLRDLVGLVEDVDLAPQVAGWIGQPLAQVADVVDAAVATRRRSR